MRRGIRGLFQRKSDKKKGEASVTEDATDATDELVDETALGLEVWVQGVNPTVEYVSSIIYSQSSILACTTLAIILSIAAKSF
jgi:hypothetical protein